MKLNNQSIIKSFAHAFNGLFYFFLHERNGKLEIGIAFIAVLLSFLMKVSISEWFAVLLCIALVVGFEMLNSALERLCDVVQEDYHPVIKLIKDMAAAAVLWCSIVSAIIGLIIFLPKISFWLSTN
jgi:undecaprenol kinase/diacylglycerol kinase (ATP)